MDKELKFFKEWPSTDPISCEHEYARAPIAANAFSTTYECVKCGKKKKKYLRDIKREEQELEKWKEESEWID